MTTFHFLFFFQIVFRVDDRVSFSNVSQWTREIERYASQNVNRIIVGNCCDIQDRKVSFEEAKDFADSMGIPYVEVSAKTGYNVAKLFLIAAALVIKRITRKEFDYIYLRSPDDNCASCVAQTVPSLFKKAKKVKILVEGCTVKFVKEKVDFVCFKVC